MIKVFKNSQYEEIDPFGKIALALLGGGYRPTAFHLGTMSNLNKCQLKNVCLIDKVEIVSTVSGSTITSVLWAIQIANKDSFENTYSRIIEFPKKDLIKEAQIILENKSNLFGKDKSRNPINTFSILYNELVDNAVLSHLSKSSLEKRTLKEVVFNTVELNNGLDFRFGNKGFLGNKPLSLITPNEKDLQTQVRSRLKLGDIIAASSCFPGAFEPMRFPQDILYEKSSTATLEAIKEMDVYKKPVGLMDGGIFDNSGINSILLAQRRSNESNYYDLLIATDVSSYRIQKAFEFHEPDESNKTIGDVLDYPNRLFRFTKYVGLLIFLVPSIPLVMHLPGKWSMPPFLVGALSTIILFSVIMFLILFEIKKRYVRLNKHVVGLLKNLIPDYVLIRLQKSNYQFYKISKVEKLLDNRIRSFSLMVSDIFLKQIRRLYQEIIYNDVDWKYRRVSNLIY